MMSRRSEKTKSIPSMLYLLQQKAGKAEQGQSDTLAVSETTQRLPELSVSEFTVSKRDESATGGGSRDVASTATVSQWCTVI